MSSFSVNENSRCVKYVFGTATKYHKHLSVMGCNNMHVKGLHAAHIKCPMFWHMDDGILSYSHLSGINIWQSRHTKNVQQHHLVTARTSAQWSNYWKGEEGAGPLKHWVAPSKHPV